LVSDATGLEMRLGGLARRERNFGQAENDGEVSPGGEMTPKKFRRVRGSFVRELWSPRVLSRREMTASNAGTKFRASVRREPSWAEGGRSGASWYRNILIPGSRKMMAGLPGECGLVYEVYSYHGTANVLRAHRGYYYPVHSGTYSA